jgi:hypothetical protein
MTLHVDVLQHHIDAGVRRDCRLCPVAMALQRATGEAWRVSEKRAVLRRGSATPIRVRIPVNVTSFIRRFDAGEPVAPFEFTIEVPD